MSANYQGIFAGTGRAHCQRQVAFFSYFCVLIISQNATSASKMFIVNFIMEVQWNIWHIPQNDNEQIDKFLWFHFLVDMPRIPTHTSRNNSSSRGQINCILSVGEDMYKKRYLSMIIPLTQVAIISMWRHVQEKIPVHVHTSYASGNSGRGN